MCSDASFQFRIEHNCSDKAKQFKTFYVVCGQTQVERERESLESAAKFLLD